MWRHDTCTRFADQFKQMVMSRAAIARLSSSKSYFDYQSQFKMMSQRSVERFLVELKSQVDPHLNAFMEDMLVRKLRDLNYDVSQEELSRSLKRHRLSLRDFQKDYEEIQLNWGDVACKYISDSSSKAESLHF